VGTFVVNDSVDPFEGVIGLDCVLGDLECHMGRWLAFTQCRLAAEIGGYGIVHLDVDKTHVRTEQMNITDYVDGAVLDRAVQLVNEAELNECIIMVPKTVFDNYWAHAKPRCEQYLKKHNLEGHYMLAVAMRFEFDGIKIGLGRANDGKYSIERFPEDLIIREINMNEL
jgi:hypothetical protein